MGDSGQTYECSKGHMIQTNQTLGTDMPQCPVYRKGHPCTGTMKRVGPGARLPNKEKQP